MQGRGYLLAGEFDSRLARLAWAAMRLEPSQSTVPVHVGVHHAHPIWHLWKLMLFFGEPRNIKQYHLSVKNGEKMLVKFEVYFDGESWCARGIGVSIFTQGKTLDELMENIKDATSLHFEDILEAGEELRVLSISEFEVHPVAKASGC
jgi:hypothetical protein